MKHITKGNDFIMRIPVVRIYNGERIPMPLPACTDIIVNICSPYRRISLAYSIDVAEDNVILAKVEGDQLYVGRYALEVKGKIGGVDWRSNEYEQIAIVDNNASADTSFDVTEEGENSLLMDTAVAILAPDTGLYDKVLTAEEAREVAENARVAAESERIAKEQERKANEDERKVSEASRVENESVRLANEQARTASEAERVKAENIRKQNEPERVRNESSRSEAETAREEAETKRKSAETTRGENETERKANENERKAAEAARAKAETLRQQAETARGNAETKRADAETARANAEKARQQAETNRAEAETLRQQKESERQEAETTRGNAESGRIEAEKTRQQNETARQEAEQERIANNEKCVTATNSALSAAEKATTAANNATNDANNAAGEANAAADRANEAADRANEAADLVYNGPDEVVAVACYSSVEGVSTAGLVLNVYINDNTVPLTYTTDENGMVSFRVTKGLRYDIVFPDIVGCSPIGRLSYTAALQTRGIEVTYLPMETTKQEHVTIAFRRYEENATWQAGTAYADGVARVTINGVETTYHADSNGMVDFFVDLNTEYTVKIDKPADLHLTNGVYQATYTADRSARVIAIAFHAYLSDFLVVDTDGNEWTYDGFINSGKDVSEALLIHVATEELLAAGCDYYLSLHVLAYGKYHGTNTAIPGRSWAAQNVTFSSVPINPDKTSEYYYDGYKSTYLIIDEGLERGISTDCHTFTARETIQIGLDTLHGYTPTKGQYDPLVANYDYINNMVNYFRPDGNPVSNFWSKNKGTSTQQSATDAYCVYRYVTSRYKNNGGSFSPFPAYAKTSL